MFIVKQKDAKHTRGIQVSRVYNSRQAADDLAALLMSKAAKDERYWVTEYIPRESKRH